MKLERVRLLGPLGQALKLNVDARLKPLDYALMVEPFRQRNETDGTWRCEFWGKVVRSAILGNASVRDDELAARIRETVADILSTQRPDGSISSYPAEKQLESWDIWGRKYVLLGLTRYYELVTPDEEVKRACIRLLDQLIAQVGGNGANLRNYGFHGGLAASSICDAAVAVYRISGERRFLDFAREIVEGGASQKHNIFTAAASGTPPAELGNGKAYEMTSCFQGMAEIALLEADETYRERCLAYYRQVRDREIFVTGVGGGADEWGEYWCEGALEQTAPRPGSALGETCVTTTWLHYCDCIYRLTGDPAVAGEAERTLYNGILGEMAPDGTNWQHRNPTPLTGGGVKFTVGDQMMVGFHTPFDGHDCCRAQGPEGLAMAPVFAVTAHDDGIAVNIFEAAEAEFSGGRLTIEGNYPYVPRAVIRATTEAEMPLFIRVAPWLKKVSLNGEDVPLPETGYLRISRRWRAEDELALDFDFSLRKIPAPGGRPYYAVMRGPLVLAEDRRGVIPAAVHAEYEGHLLCDYASVGNPPNEGYDFAVWVAERHL